MSQGDEPTTPTLEYRHRPRLSVVGLHKKKLILLALCLSMGVPFYRNWGSLKHRILWHYWFRQALAYQMPPKAVDLRIHDPTKGANAMASDPAYQMSSSWPSPTVEYAPLPYRTLRLLDSRLVTRSSGQQTVAFIGTMIRPDGVRRLVVIETLTHTDSTRFLEGTSIRVLPVPAWSDPVPPAVAAAISIEIGGGSGTTFAGPITHASLRSGVLDPSDRAHLVFEYVLGPTASLFDIAIPTTPSTTRASKVDWDEVEGTGIIDARLQNDDSMHFSVRQDPGQPQRLLFGKTRILQNAAATK